MSHFHELPKLPFSLDALEPYISKETLSYHYGKHHAGYVKNLNKAIENSKYESKTLVQIISSSQGNIFNNAAQIWNHSFYWQCLSPESAIDLSSEINQAINLNFESMDAFKKHFTETATSLFGSGWIWLVFNEKGNLEIIKTENADTPIRHGHMPLLACDVWEHAYYLDYKNARADYLQAFWKLVNWKFVNEKYVEATNNFLAKVINQ